MMRRLATFGSAVTSALLATLVGAMACGGSGSDAKDSKDGKDAKAAAKTQVAPPTKGDGKTAPADPGAGRVYWVTPTDGAKVPPTFDVEFGAEGKSIVPAGGTERDPTSGHHHIIIDGGPIPDMEIVPKDAKHLHYGGGETKTKLMLPVGKHKLTMQLADAAHQSYGPQWSATIEVEVVDDTAAPPAGP
jgi:hypothetical protein